MVETFNYEDIYEILRNEKFASDLQELSKEDLRKIKVYFKEKIKSTEGQNQSTNLFASHNRAKSQLEVDNATRVVKDLLEQRERKLINRAVFNSRIDNSMRDTSNMLEIEEELYDQLVFVLKRFRQGFLATIDNEGNYPSQIIQPLKLRKDVNVKEFIEKGKKSVEKEFREAIDKKVKESKKQEIKLAEFKIKSDTPEFFGPNMNKFGPYKEGEKVNLPKEIIKILELQEDSKEVINTSEQSKRSQNNALETESVSEALKNKALPKSIEKNEVSKNSSNILSGEGLSESSELHNEADEKQTSSEDKEKRIEQRS
ncbi:hypothetical protein HOH11_01465 [Candidatus Woesearchaeota archaeon]|jgi:hypothetical protein|nr:hypothetical protein [Candidatus Woesearchaeota archaeon]MBT6023253.1 hypothetical protein [Candidatus Woesearchaeota archaeon]